MVQASLVFIHVHPKVTNECTLGELETLKAKMYVQLDLVGSERRIFSINLKAQLCCVEFDHKVQLFLCRRFTRMHPVYIQMC